MTKSPDLRFQMLFRTSPFGPKQQMLSGQYSANRNFDGDQSRSKEAHKPLGISDAMRLLIDLTEIKM
jgi:hypothetical protein